MIFTISRTSDNRSVGIEPRPSAPTENSADQGSCYTVELDFLEDLLALTTEADDGEIVVYYKAGVPHVEIYDAYRE